MDFDRLWVISAVLSFVGLCLAIRWNMPTVRDERRLKATFKSLNRQCGVALRHFRQRRNISVKELASLLAITAPRMVIDEVTIVVIEEGAFSPDFRMVKAISGALGISMNEFVRRMGMIQNHQALKEARHAKQPVFG